MKKLIYLLIILSSVSFAADRAKNILNLLNEEIKMIEQVKNRRLSLEYRLFELYSERLSFIKATENNIFLEESIKFPKRKKASFFTKSREEYKRIKLFGNKILKRYPNTKYTPEILYTLALNSRDYGKDKKAENFLLNALKKTNSTKLKNNIKSSLADHYYNEKKYKKAIRFYSELVKDRTDNWRTKNQLNLAWSFLKAKKNDKALSMLQEAYFNSKDKQYMDISDQALNHLPLFYTLTKKFEDGYHFFIKEVVESSPYIVKMAKKAAENGEYSGALFLINESLKHYRSKDQLTNELTILTFSLNFFRQFKRWKKHELAVQDILKIKGLKKVNDELFLEAVESIKSYAGFLQLKLARNVKKEYFEYNPKTYQSTLFYFDSLITLDKENSIQYLYYKGETALSLKKYLDAGEFYTNSIKLASNGIVKKEHTEFVHKAFNSFLYILSLKAYKKQLHHDYTEFTLSSHIKIFPKDEKSKKMYPELIRLKIKDKSFNYVDKLLKSYVKAFPEDAKSQKAVYTQFIDALIEKRSIALMANTVKEMSNGFLKMGKSFIKKTEIVLGNILFEKYIALENEGKLDEAKEGNRELYKVEYYPNNIRARAAYHIAEISVKKNELKQSLEWLERAYRLFTAEEKSKYEARSLALAEDFYLKQDFSKGFDAAYFFLSQYCKSGKHTEQFFKNSILVGLMADRYFDVKKVLKNNKQCSVSAKVKTATVHRIQNYIIQFNKLDYIHDFSLKFLKDQKVKNNYFDSLVHLYWKYYWQDKSVKMRSISKDIKHLKSRNVLSKDQIALFHSVEAFTKLNKKVRKLNEYVVYDEKVFNEEKFNNQLTKTIKMVESLKKESESLLKSTNPHIILGVNNILSNIYNIIGKKIQNLQINVDDQNYLKSIKQYTGAFSKKFIAESNKIHKRTKKIIKKNIILSPYVRYALKDDSLRQSSELFGVESSLATYDL